MMLLEDKEHTEWGACIKHVEMTLKEMLQALTDKRARGTYQVEKVAKMGRWTREMPPRSVEGGK